MISQRFKQVQKLKQKRKELLGLLKISMIQWKKTMERVKGKGKKFHIVEDRTLNALRERKGHKPSLLQQVIMLSELFTLVQTRKKELEKELQKTKDEKDKQNA